MPTSSSPYADLNRPPLRQAAIQRACTPPWTRIDSYDEVDSTNRVAADAARSGVESGLVVIADSQTGGRGRLGRSWVSPPRAGLAVSMLLRPAAPVARWPWLLNLAAVAAATAVAERTGIDVALKWPNDLVVDAGEPGVRKLGGLLAEVVGSAVVIGIGINVTTRRAELPRSDATSLLLEGAEATDRLPLLLAVLRQAGSDYLTWDAAGGASDQLQAAYRAMCTTIGQRVRAELPDGSAVEGEAVDIDADGHLVIDLDGVHRAVAAADVVHLRPAD